MKICFIATSFHGLRRGFDARRKNGLGKQPRGLQNSFHLSTHVRNFCVKNFGIADHDRTASGAQGDLFQPKGFAQPAFDAVSLHGIARAPRGGKSNLSLLLRVAEINHIKPFALHKSPGLENFFDGLRVTQDFLFGQGEAVSRFIRH